MSGGPPSPAPGGDRGATRRWPDLERRLADRSVDSSPSHIAFVGFSVWIARRVSQAEFQNPANHPRSACVLDTEAVGVYSVAGRWS